MIQKNGQRTPLISVIIPVYNEEDSISPCLTSLLNQTYKRIEIIVVDDGSTDKSKDLVKKFKTKLLLQDHKGPGPARNLGASKSQGEILVFVDADMTFDSNFILDLVKPILNRTAIGTFSKNEMNANFQNTWSACWNIDRGWPKDRLIPLDYPNTAPVFRAILKKEFDSVDGFDTSGEYTDDWSLSEKLKVKSTAAKGAIYYHTNPSTLKEVYHQASWIGKNKFISGTLPRRIKSLVQYSLPISIPLGIIKSIANSKPQFLIFKVIYDLAVWQSSLKSFTNIKKFK